MQADPGDPERLKVRLDAAVNAVADVLLASRDYDGMRRSSLKAYGQAAREFDY